MACGPLLLSDESSSQQGVSQLFCDHPSIFSKSWLPDQQRCWHEESSLGVVTELYAAAAGIEMLLLTAKTEIFRRTIVRLRACGGWWLSSTRTHARTHSVECAVELDSHGHYYYRRSYILLKLGAMRNRVVLGWCAPAVAAAANLV
mmetsp:Transcript_1824/g.2838  ORF Transcript_1824/g.2838 Transcript_1824/m.2838 type:complete len:146 (-) Transcript_1824:91-528(-)